MSYWKFCHQCGLQVGDGHSSQCGGCKAHLHCSHCDSPIFPAAKACGGCGKLLAGSAVAGSSSYTGTGYSSSSYSSVGSYASSSSTSSSYKSPAYASSPSGSTPLASKATPASSATASKATPAATIENPATGSGYHGSGYGGSGFGGSKAAQSYASPVIATGAVLGGASALGSFKSTFPSPTQEAAPAASPGTSDDKPAGTSLEENIDAILGTDAEARSKALAELKKRPHDLKELVAALEKPSRIERIRPARVLLQLEHEPIKAAAAISDALCNDPSWSTRKAALDALVSEGQKAKDAIPSLSKALADGRVDRKEITCMAAEALGAVSPKAQVHAAKALEKALNSDNWFLREAAKKALEKIKK